MRSLVNAAAEEEWRWLAVQVPREANSDADRLSHPRLARAVAAEAEAARLAVTWLEPADGDWDQLRTAIAAGSDASARRRYKRRRRR